MPVSAGPSRRIFPTGHRQTRRTSPAHPDRTEPAYYESDLSGHVGWAPLPAAPAAGSDTADRCGGGGRFYMAAETEAGPVEVQHAAERRGPAASEEEIMRRVRRLKETSRQYAGGRGVVLEGYSSLRRTGRDEPSCAPSDAHTAQPTPQQCLSPAPASPQPQPQPLLSPVLQLRQAADTAVYQ
eukprot:Rhum_TRINITY_DN14119_c1_g4::Rhum_TRINITY_DN14119_c1_g4_i1::g.69680::m.69680